jgi:predicted permease
MNGLMQDFTFAFRQFRKSPGFALTAIVSLMLGIGATTAIFSVVYGVLVDPYPYRDNDRMVHVELRGKGDERGGPLLTVNAAEYPQLRQVSSIEDVFLQQGRNETLTGDQLPVSVNVGLYSPNLFEYMGVQPLIGREFSPTDAPNGSVAPVAVLSYLFWQKQYGGNPNAVGRTIQLDHKLYTVIGVARPRFTWGDSDVYLPALPTADPHDYWLSFIRLKPGASFGSVSAELQVLVDRFTRDDPQDFRRDRKVHIVTLNEEVLGKFSGTLVLLFGAVLALLLIGCANVSILLLARGTARQHELAMRASLGAGRSRLVQQLLTEAVLLSVTGAALGVLLAYRGVKMLQDFLPFYSFPHEAAIHLSMPVLIFSAGVALMTGILAGVSPAWRLSRPNLSQVIQSGSTRVSLGVRERKLHRLLIAGQVALTVVLLAGAGAAARGFLAKTRTPLGFDPHNVLTFNVAFPSGANPTWQERLNAQENLRRVIGQVPGVESAGVSTTYFPPLGGFRAKIEIQGNTSLAEPQAMLGLISPELFQTVRMQLLSGRFFDDAEATRAAHVALVNQSFVKQFMGGGDPIGHSVRSPMLKVPFKDLLNGPDPDGWLQIIGVVADAKNDGLDRPVLPAVFLPYSFVLTPDLPLLLRTTSNPDAVLLAVKQRLREINGEIVVNNDRTLLWWLDTQGWGRERFIAGLFSVFAGLALALAATGLYSVVSFGVTQRTQELGIRIALGAQRTSVVRLVLTSTTAMLLLGIGLGVGLSVALNKVLSSWAGANSRDPLTLLGASAVLLAISAVACVLPAWRAATVNPMLALRTE